MSTKAPAAVKTTEKEINPRKIIKKVRVHRLNVDESNKELIITVNDLGDTRHGKKEFIPGQEVELTQAQINILRAAVERQEITLDTYSGVHTESNPLMAAEKQFPGFKAHYDRHTGSVIVVKETPNYSIETVE